MRPTLGMSEPWRYRNKSQVPIGVTEGGLVGGFMPGGGSWTWRHVSSSMSRTTRLSAASKPSDGLGITAYNEETGQGLLRHVVKIGFATREMMIVRNQWRADTARKRVDRGDPCPGCK